MTYKKLDKVVEFDAYFSSHSDHIIFIKKAGYNDIEIYYVIVGDAYRTPTMNIMSSSDIKTKFGIEL
jgi:hypothetical protein